jgi:hypothetical protein
MFCLNILTILLLFLPNVIILQNENHIIIMLVMKKELPDHHGMSIFCPHLARRRPGIAQKLAAWMIIKDYL